jgi:hypothetical protein
MYCRCINIELLAVPQLSRHSLTYVSRSATAPPRVAHSLRRTKCRVRRYRSTPSLPPPRKLRMPTEAENLDLPSCQSTARPGRPIALAAIIKSILFPLSLARRIASSRPRTHETRLADIYKRYPDLILILLADPPLHRLANPFSLHMLLPVPVLLPCARYGLRTMDQTCKL